jgi:hypothetical protein
MTPLPPLGIGALVAQSFRLLFANFGTLFPLAFVPALLLAVLGWVTQPAEMPADPTAIPDLGFSLGTFLVGLLAALVGFFVMGFMSLAALDAVLGKRHTVAEYTAQTLRHLVPIVVLSIVLSIAVFFGLLLLVVPGLYLAARFLPWIQAVVFENAGWSGLARANQLTEGYRWPLVGAVLLMGIIIVAASLVIAPLAVMPGGLIGVLVEAVVSGLYYALVSIFTALVYARLREVKEGLGIPQIAALID